MDFLQLHTIIYSMKTDSNHRNHISPIINVSTLKSEVLFKPIKIFTPLILHS